MRGIRRLTVAAVVFGVAAMMTLLASGAEAQTASPTPKKLTLIVASTNDIETVNPLRAIETPEYEVMGLEYDLLFNFSKENLQAVPGLATEIPTKENGGLSEDGLTWTIKIRDDAMWSDGQPLTAHDIAFTYNLILDNNFSNFTGYLPYVDSITAPDDTTLVWKTTKPTLSPIIPPWIYILPEHVWSQFKTKEDIRSFEDFPDPVTSGPFRMVEWNKGEDWTLEANKDYWGGTPTIDEVIFKVYKNAETMVQDLKQGAIDFAENIPADLFPSVQDQPGITANVGSAFQYDQMSFNMCDASDPNAAPYCKKNPGTGNPALLDLNVRKAIAMAVDKQALVDRVLQGYGTVGSTMVVPGAAFWHWEPTDPIAFDIPGANALLDQAGYEDTDGNGIRNDPKTGDDLKFRFILRSDSPSTTAMGKLIVGWVKQIGIQLSPVSYTDGKLIDAWYANDYDMYIWGWGPDPDPDFILSTYTADQCGAWSDTCWSDPTYNQLYEAQRTATDPDQRKQIIDQMQQLFYEQIPEVVLEYGNDLQAWRSDRWTGFQFQPTPDDQGRGGNALYQYGNYSYLTVKPASAAAGTQTGSSGLPPWLWIVIVAGIVVIVGGVMLIRRRTPEEERA
ncbi:MAG: ABC transporter substrate-binding protein [Candidatus Velamenicoccus archaeovorus]